MESATAQVSGAHLLGVPGEIRNKIHEYALGTNSGTVYLLNACGRPRARYPTVKGHNQLKYTCRQLYNETAGLELKYNDFNFHARMGYTAYGDIPLGLRNVMSNLANHPLSNKLVNLRIQPFARGSNEATEQFDVVDHYRYADGACLQFSSITVKVILCNLRPKEWTMPWTIWLLALALRLHQVRGNKVPGRYYLPPADTPQAQLPLAWRTFLRAAKYLPDPFGQLRPHTEDEPVISPWTWGIHNNGYILRAPSMRFFSGPNAG